MVDIAQAITSLKPGASFGYEADDIETLKWESDNIIQPTNAEILTERERLELKKPIIQKRNKIKRIKITIINMRLRKDAASAEGFADLEAETQSELDELRAELSEM